MILMPFTASRGKIKFEMGKSTLDLVDRPLTMDAVCHVALKHADDLSRVVIIRHLTPQHRNVRCQSIEPACARTCPVAVRRPLSIFVVHGPRPLLS